MIANAKSKLKNLEQPKLQGQAPGDINRSEFIEILIRIAIFKYKDQAPKGLFLNMEECVEKVIEEKLKPNYTPAPWQVHREEEIWTREVNIVFHDNREGLQQLYQKYS